MGIELSARESDELPATSCFQSVEEASSFFEGGSVGYSVTRDCCRLDGIRLEVNKWRVRPLDVDQVVSSYFEDSETFPPGSARFDHALIMRDILHEWHKEEDIVMPVSANPESCVVAEPATRLVLNKPDGEPVRDPYADCLFPTLEPAPRWKSELPGGRVRPSRSGRHLSGSPEAGATCFAASFPRRAAAWFNQAPERTRPRFRWAFSTFAEAAWLS